MKNFLRSILSPWVALILAALGLIVALDLVRVRHIGHVTAVGEEPDAALTPAPGLLGGWSPRLIVPEHDINSLAWLSLTRQMLETGDARIRRIDYENAPFGREVYATSPYRWWLGAVAWCDHQLTGVSLGRALERAALIANPLLQVLLLLGAAGLVAWRFGVFSAALTSLAIAALFPFAAEFVPGLPRDAALSQVLGVATILLLLAAFRPAAGTVSRRAGVWFALSGVAGGLGLWVSVARGVPVLIGLGLGALVAAWSARPTKPGEPAPLDPRLWRTWALAGALTTFAAFVVEFAPDYLGLWQTRVIHPLYALSWLGGGEVLVVLCGWLGSRPTGSRGRSIGGLALGVAALAALPVAMGWTKSWGFLATELDRLRLAHLPAGPSANHSLSWFLHDGLSGVVWATLLPALLLLPVAWWLARRRGPPGERLAAALAVGVVAVQLGFAARWLSSWNGVGAALVALIAVVAAGRRVLTHPRWNAALLGGGWALLALPGIVQLVPHDDDEGANSLDPREIYGLVERDLARWLAARAPDPHTVVLAPHNLSATLHYYGGLRGLSSLAWENSDGLGVVIRIASASTPEEARELLLRRHVTYLVIPTWDAYLDMYASIGMGELDGTFLKSLHEWKLPPWLQPVPYQMPQITGFDGEAVTVLRFVEDQEDAPALSRIAEYFVEMRQLDRAASTAQALRRFPADLGALVARAQVDFARNDTASFERTVALLKPRVTSGGDRSLPWDRRLSLAVVLTQAKLKDLARERVKRCLAELDEAKLRSLSTASVYRLLVLSRAYEQPIADAGLRELALSFLPSDMRSRLE